MVYDNGITILWLVGWFIITIINGWLNEIKHYDNGITIDIGKIPWYNDDFYWCFDGVLSLMMALA